MNGTSNDHEMIESSTSHSRLVRSSSLTENLVRMHSSSDDEFIALQQRTSCWETDTPMTTRPHFFSAEHSASPRRRTRSRSLGSSREGVQSTLLMPPRQRRHTPPTHRRRDDDQEEEVVENPLISVMYGMINATIVLPVLISFGSIIYRDQAFQPYTPVLVKLTVVSGIVHQLCFTTFSSLPFAIGQVQDAGLIFLSSMATSIVQYCQNRGYDDETLLATTTVGLALCTTILGCGLVLVGKLKLAQYVQMLPTCVVGGYLAYIGTRRSFALLVSCLSVLIRFLLL